jgi:hypothetical protein
MNYKLFLLAVTFTINFAAFSQSETVVKMRLDSVVATKHFKQSFFYDEKGNEIQHTEYFWNKERNDWKERRKYEYMYDSNKNLITMIVQNFSEFEIRNGLAYPLTKNEYTYNANGTETMYVKYYWNYKNNDWGERYEHKSIYDSNNNKIMYIESRFKIEYAYNNDGKIIKETEYNRNHAKNVWKKYSKTEYTYNDNSNKKRDVYYSCYRKKKYYSLKRICQEEYEIEYLYDNNGNLIMMLKDFLYIYGKEKVEYMYDSNKNQIKNEFYEFGENNTLTFGRKYEYVYDSNQNLIRKILYFIENNNTWKEGYKDEYLYDTLYPKENLIIPLFPYSYGSLYNYNYMLIEGNTYNWESNDWKCSSTNKYYYSPQTK